MAKAYLGKISALVTANTSDFNSKLNASAKEVRSFASSMQSTLSRAQTSATASLRGIYTESQKVSRALQAVATQRLSFKGFDRSAVGSIREAVDQFRALQAASVAVNEPLSNAARTVERLSASVQQSFDPALKSAQKSAEYLDAALKRGGIVGEQSFERIRQKALAAAEAANRLAEASQLAAGGPRGNELAFAAPRVRDALAASADVRQRAANAPAVALEGGRVSSDVQKLVALDNLIQKRRAEIESGTILNIDTTQARASLENLLAVAKRVREQVNSAIGGGPDAETATLINRARGQREFYEESERLAKQAATDEVALIARRTNAQRESSEERTRLERQAAADEVALIARRTNAQREGYEERTRLERQAAEDAATLLIRQARAQQEFEEERRRRDAVAASDAANEVAPAINRSRVQRESAIDFGLDLDAPQRQIEVLRGSIVSLKGQLDTLPAGVRSQFIPAIIAAQQNLEALAATPAATTAELSRAAREVDRLTQALGRARQAANIPSFRRFAADLSTRAAIGELQALQQILARIGAQAGGPAAQAYDRYAAALRRATRDGTTQLPETRRELERLQVAAARAAAETGRISFRGALREIRRGGDIARGGFDNLSLAVNQAAFAIDDFFSSTGGLEFKLRAISNNVTQLAFILGGTRGLFIGLAAVIGGQLAVAITKWVNGGRIAEDTTNALNDSLSRQKTLAEELTQAFQSLGDAMSRKGLSRQAQEAREFEKALDDIQKKQKQARENRAVGADQGVVQAQAAVNVAKRRVEKAETVGESVAAQRELADAERRLAEERRRAVSRPAVTADEAKRVVDDVLRSESQVRASAAARNEDNPVAKSEAVRRELAAGERRQREAVFAGNAEEIRRSLEKQLADLIERGAPAGAIARIQSLIDSLQLPIEELRDAALVGILRASNDLAASIGQGQAIIDDAFGESASRTRSILDRAQRQLDDLRTRAEQSARPDLFEADIAVLSEFVDELKASSIAVRVFASAMNDFAESFQSDVGSRRRMAEDARRADVLEGSPASAARRRRAEEEFSASRRRQREFADAQATDRERVEQEMLENGQAVADRLRQIEEQLAVPANEISSQGVAGGTVAERESLRSERRRLQDQVDSQVEASPAAREQRRLADVESRMLAQEERADRGRRSFMTQGERAAEDLNQQIADIREYATRAAEESSGLPEDVAKIRNRMNEAIGRAEEDMMRQVAPTITGMADSVRNAVALGPSRAALNASDVTTSQGQQELNRLLRGDDPAREVDLAALQREANRLLEVIARKEAPVAV